MDKILGLIGLAKRAGKVLGGEFAVSAAVKDKSAKLVIIATDASDNTKKSMKNSCEYYKVKYIEFSDADSLGRYTGSNLRALIAITDSGFAKAIEEKIN